MTTQTEQTQQRGVKWTDDEIETMKEIVLGYATSNNVPNFKEIQDRQYPTHTFGSVRLHFALTSRRLANEGNEDVKAKIEEQKKYKKAQMADQRREKAEKQAAKKAEQPKPAAKKPAGKKPAGKQVRKPNGKQSPAAKPSGKRPPLAKKELVQKVETDLTSALSLARKAENKVRKARAELTPLSMPAPKSAQNRK
jgi:hypothetical protein